MSFYLFSYCSSTKNYAPNVTSVPIIFIPVYETFFFIGGSSGTALCVGFKAAKELKAGQRCVIILPDGIRNYMSKMVSDHWMEARDFMDYNRHNNDHW